VRDIIVFVSGFIASSAVLALMVGDTLWAAAFALISLTSWMLGKQWIGAE